MNCAPIVMFVYNRADHFLQTFEALAKCDGAKLSDLYIFSDGYKDELNAEKVNAVRQAAHRVENDSRFKKIEIIESKVNKGLAKSVINGVTAVLEKYGRVIVIEDDCVTSPYFLRYMNSCLDFYENNLKIGSLAGFVPSVDLPKDYTYDVFSAYRSCSWGWATWKNRWDNADWDLKNVDSFYLDRNLVKKLNSNGSDRFLRLYRQTKGNGSSWSVRFGAHLVKNDMLTIYPKYSYIKNIGCDESGVHSKSDDAEKMRVDLDKAIGKPEIVNVPYDNRIQKILKKHYSCGMLSDLKRLTATKAVILKERAKAFRKNR